MSDLYEFPYLELKEPVIRQEEVVSKLSDFLGITLNYVSPLSTQKHSFTRYRAELFPHLLNVKIPCLHAEAEKKIGLLWQNKQSLLNLPFSSGHKRILKNLLDL
jgi:A/G-specific adenine glycosylase